MSNISYKILITFLQNLHFSESNSYEKCYVYFDQKFVQDGNIRSILRIF